MGGFRRRLMGSSAGTLPAGYTRYDWISSDSEADQYIETNLKMYTAGFTMDFCFSFSSKPNTKKYMTGVKFNGSGSPILGAELGIEPGNYAGVTNMFFDYCGTENAKINSVDLTTNTKYRVEISFQNGSSQQITVTRVSDGVVVASFSSSDSTWSGATASASNIPLWKSLRISSLASPANLKMYDTTITASAYGSHTFVPCTNPSNIPGMYDMTSGVFYPNSYANPEGDFIVGND